MIRFDAVTLSLLVSWPLVFEWETGISPKFPDVLRERRGVTEHSLPLVLTSAWIQVSVGRWLEHYEKRTPVVCKYDQRR